MSMSTHSIRTILFFEVAAIRINLSLIMGCEQAIPSQALAKTPMQ